MRINWLVPIKSLGLSESRTFRSSIISTWSMNSSNPMDSHHLVLIGTKEICNNHGVAFFFFFHNELVLVLLPKRFLFSDHALDFIENELGGDEWE